MKLLQPLRILIVSFFYILLSQYATAAGSAYAVFKMSYSETSPEVVIGGVAGSAFFVKSNLAYSAAHVLNPGLFEPAPGHDKIRVWLVHENEDPIEVFAKDVITDSSKDFAKIQTGKNVPAKYIFEFDSSLFAKSVLEAEAAMIQTRSLGQSAAIEKGAAIESEGFRANSVGPKLGWVQGRIEILKVPKLERIKVQGQILRMARVTVNAKDLQVHQAHGMEVSYESVVGMSGGPVLHQGRIIGFNSFADFSAHKTWILQVPQAVRDL